jgi:hypothetical protein
MNVRAFDWRDLPALHRWRNQTIFLDSQLCFTRGPLLVPGVLISYLPMPMAVMTCISNGLSDENSALIGQVIHNAGSQFAHLTFLTPQAALESSALPALLDYLAVLSGERGAFRLLADVNENSPAFEALRRVCFSTFTRQRIWQFTGATQVADSRPSVWQIAASQDVLAIRSLYNNLVPGLVQQVEPCLLDRPHGMVFYQDGDLLGYVELRYGYRGIWAQPFIHPDASGLPECFIDLMMNMPRRRGRPIYLCIRSYQSWLEPTIDDLGAEAGPRQAVMVKHLAVSQKVARVFSIPVLEGGHPEVSAPIARSERH